jgi:MtN3 and saliva related transmembrane protein
VNLDLTFTAGIVLWFAYGVAIDSWPIILSNIVSFLLAATILALEVRHG